MVLIILAIVFVYALPLLELPIITTPDSDFGGVLFTMSIYALVALGLLFAIAAITQPAKDASASAGTVVVFLTSGTSWTVPSDWNNAANTVEVIGGGGGGSNGADGVGVGVGAQVGSSPVNW